MRNEHSRMLLFRDIFVSMRSVSCVLLKASETATIPRTQEHSLLCVIEGGGQFHCATNRVHALTSKDILLIQPGETVGVVNDEERSLRYYVISYDRHYVANRDSKHHGGLQSRQALFEGDVVLLRASDQLIEMMKDIYNNANSKDEKEHGYCHFLFQKMMYTLIDLQQSQTARIHPYEAVKQTISYLTQHYQEPLTVAHLAQKANLSRQWYTVLFKEITGEKPVDYLTALRIRKAKELMNLTKESFYEIAHRVGFEDEHYFSRRFKQNVGVSPRSYLRNRKILGTTVTYPEMLHMLGHTPIAVQIQQAEYPLYLKEPFKHVQKIRHVQGEDLDYLRAYAPDLIVASEWQDREHYDALSRIATTVLLPERQKWQDELRDMGDILGVSKQVVEIIQHYEDELDRARERLYVLAQGQSIAYLRWTSEGIVAFGKKSSRGNMLYRELGLKTPEGASFQEDGTLLSIEALASLQADHILLHVDDVVGKQEQSGLSSLWQQLSRAHHDHIYRVQNNEWFNFSFSPLSTGFALGELVRTFEAKNHDKFK